MVHCHFGKECTTSITSFKLLLTGYELETSEMQRNSKLNANNLML